MYQHQVQYYETDRMGITHHSNYVRWMEEARVSFLAEHQYGYDRLEEEGIVSPVLSVSCEYKKTTTFAQTIDIAVEVKSFNGVKLVLEYVMKREDEVVCVGESRHCFLNKEGRPLRMKKEYPAFYEMLKKEETCRENSGNI